MQNPPAQTPIVVTLAPSQVDIAPGSPPAQMNISVLNSGQSVEQFGIDIEGIDPSWASLDVQSLSLFPGDSFDGKLTLQIPQGSRPVGGAYPFTVHVRSRVNPQISGAARGLARVGSGPATKPAGAAKGKRSLWLPIGLISVALALLAVAAYFLLGSSKFLSISPSSTPTPLPTATVVAQVLPPTSTPPPPATPTKAASATPVPQPTVCGSWAMEHRGKQDTRFPPGFPDVGPYQAGGKSYKYRADYTSVIYVNATGVISSVRIANLDVFKGGQQQTEAIVGTLVSPHNVRIPLFTWTCDPGSLVSMHVNLDDNAKGGIPYSCSENMSGTFKADSALSVLKGQPAEGNWLLEMSVYSLEERPTSYFNSWGLELCTK